MSKYPQREGYAREFNRQLNTCNMLPQNIPKMLNINGLIICITISIALSIARLVPRFFIRSLVYSATEDIFMIFALAFYVTVDSLYLFALPILYQRLDHPVSVSGDEYTITVYFANDIIFWLAVWSVKFSLLSALYRLTNGLSRHRKYWCFVMGLTILAIIGSVVPSVISCSSMTAWFTPGGCETNRDTFRKAVSLYCPLAADIITDMLIMLLPIHLVWTAKNINTRGKICVIIAFGAAIISIIFAIVRVVLLELSTKDGVVNPTYLAMGNNIDGLSSMTSGCMLRFIIFFRSKATGSRNISDGVSQHQSDVQSREKILLRDAEPIGCLSEGSTMSTVDSDDSPRLSGNGTEVQNEHEEVYREV